MATITRTDSADYQPAELFAGARILGGDSEWVRSEERTVLVLKNRYPPENG